MKELIRRVAHHLGYEIRHRSVAPGDPFVQQKWLLGDTPAPVIFDVGANVGDVTRHYRKLFAGAHIYAFEPFPEVFDRLQKSVRDDPRVTPCRLALGKGQARAELQVNAASPTNSLLETDDSAASFWGRGTMETTTKVEVEVSTLDSFCHSRGIGHIDLLKLDTQGTELQILEGGTGMLSEGRIRVIYTEMIVAPSYKGQAKPYELPKMLDQYGYTLYGLYNLWSQGGRRLLQMDAIFLRTDAFRKDVASCGTD